MRTEEGGGNSVQSELGTNHRGACGKKMATWVWRCEQKSILYSNIPGSATVQGTYAQLTTSKTRVAPMKPKSIPRLELMAGRYLQH